MSTFLDDSFFKDNVYADQERGVRYVEELASSLGSIDQWVQSQATEWKYATLTIKGHQFRVGVSTGGVVSINGDPFVPSSRAIVIGKDGISQSITERLEQIERRMRLSAEAKLNVAQGAMPIKNSVLAGGV